MHPSNPKCPPPPCVPTRAYHRWRELGVIPLGRRGKGVTTISECLHCGLERRFTQRVEPTAHGATLSVIYADAES